MKGQRAPAPDQLLKLAPSQRPHWRGDRTATGEADNSLRRNCRLRNPQTTTPEKPSAEKRDSDARS
jgi:hypothetical protein